MVEVISDRTSNEFERLAADIAQLHREYESIMAPAADKLRQANEKALKLGQLIENLKGQTKHGTYLSLLRLHEIPERTAQRFRRLFALNRELLVRNPQWKEQWSMSRALDELVGELSEVSDPDDELDAEGEPSDKNDAPVAFEGDEAGDLDNGSGTNAAIKSRTDASQNKAIKPKGKGKTNKKQKPSKQGRVSVSNLMRPAEKAIGKLRDLLSKFDDPRRLHEAKDRAQVLQVELLELVAECDQKLADLQPDRTDEGKAVPTKPKRKPAKRVADTLFADTTTTA